MGGAETGGGAQASFPGGRVTNKPGAGIGPRPRGLATPVPIPCRARPPESLDREGIGWCGNSVNRNRRLDVKPSSRKQARRLEVSRDLDGAQRNAGLFLSLGAVCWRRNCDPGGPGIKGALSGHLGGASTVRSKAVAMKEEKEHRPKEKRVTLLTPPGATGSGGGASGDSTKGEDKQDRNKDKKEALSKVPGHPLARERAGRGRHPWRMVGNRSALFLSQAPLLFLHLSKSRITLSHPLSRNGGIPSRPNLGVGVRERGEDP